MGATILHTIAGLKDRAGGVARSVPGLCEALAREGCRTVLVTQEPHDAPRTGLLIPESTRVDTRLLAGYDFERFRLSYTPRLSRRLATICKEVSPDIWHDHGLWLEMNHVAANVAGRMGIKRVVSPRGMLDEWSLSYRGWKKKLAWHAYQCADLRKANAFCATSIAEARGIRALGFEQPIAVIPNGIEIPRVSKDGGERNGPRTVLFLSRLHPKKGLLDLVAAWATVVAPGWRLVIAGPDEDGFGLVVKQAVAEAGVSESITFTGSVEGAAKHDLLCSADVFVLPSLSENFGNAVGEALAYGVPAIATTAMPWEELASAGCGWWVEPGARALESALREAMGLSAADRSAMGLRGRQLIERRYSWPSIARMHLEFYRWISGVAPAPKCLLP